MCGMKGFRSTTESKSKNQHLNCLDYREIQQQHRWMEQNKKNHHTNKWRKSKLNKYIYTYKHVLDWLSLCPKMCCRYFFQLFGYLETQIFVFLYSTFVGRWFFSIFLILKPLEDNNATQFNNIKEERTHTPIFSSSFWFV